MKEKKILMILPIKRQFLNVKGKWTEMVWKSKAYDGSDAPDWDKWVQNIYNMIDVLRKEGIEVFLAVDRDEYELVKNNIKVDKFIQIKMPENLPKIGYSRDQSVTFFHFPLVLNMTLDIRRGEEEILNDIYYEIGYPPIFRPRWYNFGKEIIRCNIEGETYLLLNQKNSENEIVVFTGIGVRGTNWAGIRCLSEILPKEVKIVGIPLQGYITDWTTGAVHLDVAFSFLGKTNKGVTALIDPERIGLYSSIELDKETGFFRLKGFMNILNELGVMVDELPITNQSKITMINSLNLGNGKIVSDGFNELVNEYIEKTYGLYVLRVNIPQIEAGGG